MEENGIWGTNEMRIAICDDEKKLRNSLRRVLETQLQLDGVDYEIQEYECGEDLLAKIEHNVPGYRDEWNGRHGDGQGASQKVSGYGVDLCDSLSGFCVSGI